MPEATAAPAPTEAPPPTEAPTVSPTRAATATPVPVPTAVPGVDPIAGGTLTAVQHLNGRGVDPLLRIVPGIVTPVRPIYDKLIELSKFDGSSPVPDLATEWSLSSDARVYTFKLHEGVKFHDGSDFTAEDVVYSMDRMKNPEKYRGRRRRRSVEAARPRERGRDGHCR